VRLEPLASLTEEEVGQVCASVGLPAPQSTELLPGGLVNSNYRMRTGEADVLLRVYPQARLDEEVRFELSVIRHLSSAGLPVPDVLPVDRKPEPLSVGGRLAAVLTYLPGRALLQEELSADVAAQAGLLYRSLVSALDGFVPSGAKDDADAAAVSALVDEAVAGLQSCDRGSAVLLRDSYASIAATFAEPARRAVVHGDLYYENVLVTPGPEGLVLSGVVDFDDAYVGDALLDLALVATEFAYLPGNVLDLDLLASFLRAFQGAEPGAPAWTPEVFVDACTFVFCKFACYTLPLQNGPSAYTGGNEYLGRLEQVRDPARRTALLSVLGDVLAEAS
jgi:homoserine kinase type II